MNSIAGTTHAPPTSTAHRVPDHDAIRALYAQTQQDFGAWSAGFNMHFGYWEPGMSLFDREAMVERLNTEAISALRLERIAPPVRVVDLGCGAGATARALARRRERPRVTGVTLVPESIALAKRLDRAEGLSQRIGYALCDLCDTWMAAATMDGALAIESFCYAPGDDKAAALREAARLLKPGARLVVIDGFATGKEPRGALAWAYLRWLDCWAVPGLARLDAFLRAMAAAGFEEIEVRELFAQVAPSAAHIPWVAIAHTAATLWRRKGRLAPWQWRHIGASWLSMPLGLARRHLRYCMVTATRRRER